MKNEIQKQKQFVFLIISFIKGMLIGIANAIPGVSGGTVAVLLRVYQELLDALGLHWKKIKQNLRLLIPLLLGMVAGIFGFSNLLTILFQDYSMPTYFAFIGLILGSIPFVLQVGEINKVDLATIIPFLAALAVILLLSFVTPSQNEIHTNLSFSLFILLLLASMLAAIAMIIPGISGSFVLLVLGYYETVIRAISTLNIVMIIPVGIGILIGIVIGSRLISYCLLHFRKLTYAAILGFLVGSIFVLFPGFQWDLQGAISIITLIGGFFLAYFFSKE